MSAAADFARIEISTGVWLVECSNPQPFQLDATTRALGYSLVRLTLEKSLAIVFWIGTAETILAILRTSYPEAKIDPATFAEWIHAPEPQTVS